MNFEIGARGRVHLVDAERTSDGLIVRLATSGAGSAGPARSVPAPAATPAPTVAPTTVRLEPAAGSECWRLLLPGRVVPVRVRLHDDQVLVTIGAERVVVRVRRALPVPSRRAGSRRVDRFEVRAPMPGLLVEIPVEAGQRVASGSIVAIVEAMKMQMEVPSPAAGIVEDIRVRPGTEVSAGQALVLLRAEGAVVETEEGRTGGRKEITP